MTYQNVILSNLRYPSQAAISEKRDVTKYGGDSLMTCVLREDRKYFNRMTERRHSEHLSNQII